MALPPKLQQSLDAVVTNLGGEERPGQIEMLSAVDKALRTKSHLLVQAGTGTGKSVAYLLPAIVYAMETNQCVVVSTATLALQQQLIGRDLPRIATALEPILGRKPRFAVAKGRHHYICKSRLHNSVIPEDDDDDQAALFAAPSTRLGKEAKRVRTWALQTKTGDREELEPAADPRVWRALSVSGNECVGASKCSWGSECFAESARDEASSADIVVTNHAMLVIHALEGVPLLPDHAAVIVDEGHELADRVTGQATAELSAVMLDRAASKCRRILSPQTVLSLEEAGQDVRLLLEDLARPNPRRIVMDVAEMGENAADFFVSLKDIVPSMTAVRDAVAEALQELTALNRSEPDPEPDELAARSLAKVALADINDVAGRLLKLSDFDVAWLERADSRNPSMRVAPLVVSHLLAENLFGDVPVIVTSATLALGGKFESMAKNLGLIAPEKGLDTEFDAEDFADPEWDEEGNQVPPKSQEQVLTHEWSSLDVGTPFDAKSQGVLYIAKHLPPPGRDGLSDEQLAELTRLVIAAGGRTLALFSSWRAVEKAADALEPALRAAGVDAKVLVQRKGDVVADLVKRFATDTTSVLLGTVSLWQGVDVPGESCSLVVIDRIPFPRPDDPLHAARQQKIDRAGGSGFRSIAVPRAALLLAQGAGRLLRTQNDRGMVAVLDSRLATANYANFLLESMPDFWRTTDPEVATAAIKRLGSSLGLL
jgi:ATP-dependent DNA helicase DinG